MPAMPLRERRPSRPSALAVRGSLWLEVDGRSLGGHGRIALLRAVAEHGSITRGAQAFGMSYKAAWDAIDQMNGLAGHPLVERVTGGRGGGSTRLTEHGRRLVERYEQVDAVHQRFVRLLAERAMDLTEEFSLLKVLNVKSSARNQWVGTVAAIRAGAVNDEVEIALAGGTRLAAIVTRESTDALGLRLQQTVIALVKSSAVLLATDLGGAKVSARNRVAGVVQNVRPGAVNAEVTLAGDGGLPVVAVVTQGAVDALELAPGRAVTILVKASDVVLATVT
jgi:molybdate transport system regulatory protein